ncbi:MAG: hypothetical protein QOK44_2402 [Betaproteobacteria bacterium]|jgi:hypothetical protein|nr:hypothetical protein [Betaproteobacteria bacterium]
MSAMIKNCCLLVFVTVLAVAPALGQATTQQGLETQGARLLTREAVEKLVLGSRISMVDAQTTQTWTHGARGNLIATLARSGVPRPINGQGTAKVDQTGAYCVRIEWPKTVESWCRHIFALDGSYYAVSDDPRQTQVNSLQVVQPNMKRLSTLTRLWSLARFATGGAAR